MDERLRFVARLLDGEKMAALCREFGISRPTGYKIFDRYKNLGLEGLLDRSRRPYRQANRLPFQVERTIVALRQEHPTWGAVKIREKILRDFPMVPAPAKSTVHAVLDRHGLVHSANVDATKPKAPSELNELAQRSVVRRLQRRVSARQPPVLLPTDGDGLQLSLPAGLRGLGQRNRHSRSPCSSASSGYGTPAIRTDNGAVASSNAMFGLSRLSV
jgi:putative transposase